MKRKCQTREMLRFLRVAAPAMALVQVRASNIFASNVAQSVAWSGYCASPDAGESFVNIEGTFTIPTLYVGPATVANKVGYWMGFDGWNDVPVEQCGVGSSVQGAGLTSY